MDIQNAFIGRKTPPAAEEVMDQLGPAASVWNDLIAWLTHQSIDCKEWNSVSPKYGWALRPKLKKRTILYIAPCAGCFRVTLVLGDKAVAQARASDLPRRLVKEIEGARRYAEGTGVRLMVHQAENLAAVRQLVAIKLQN